MSSIVGITLETIGVKEPAQPVSIVTAQGEILEFDATVREVHSGQSQPTDQPVEGGATVSDHVINLPDELQIEGIVTNHPILALASVRKKPAFVGGDPNSRAEDAYAIIVSWRKTAQLVTVSTGLRDYENMIILSESVPRDKDTSEIIDISIRLREFHIATVESVDAPDPVDTVDGPKKNLGRKQTTPAADAAPEVEAKADSLFVSIAEAFQ